MKIAPGTLHKGFFSCLSLRCDLCLWFRGDTYLAGNRWFIGTQIIDFNGKLPCLEKHSVLRAAENWSSGMRSDLRPLCCNHLPGMAFLSGTGAQTQEFSLTSLVIWPLASQRLYHPPSPTSSCSFSPPFSPLFHHISPVLFRRLSQAPFHHSHALVHHF